MLVNAYLVTLKGRKINSNHERNNGNNRWCTVFCWASYDYLSRKFPMNDKIKPFGSLVQAIRNLEEAAKDFEILYDASWVRLPKEDVEAIAKNVSQARKLLQKISSVNGNFKKIANN